MTDRDHEAEEARERAQLESDFLAAAWWTDDPPDLMDEVYVNKLAEMLPADARESYGQVTCCIRWGKHRWERRNDGNAIGAALLFIRARMAEDSALALEASIRAAAKASGQSPKKWVAEACLEKLALDDAEKTAALLRACGCRGGEGLAVLR